MWKGVSSGWAYLVRHSQELMILTLCNVPAPRVDLCCVNNIPLRHKMCSLLCEVVFDYPILRETTDATKLWSNWSMKGMYKSEPIERRGRRSSGSSYHVISNCRESQDEMLRLGHEVFEVAERRSQIDSTCSRSRRLCLSPQKDDALCAFDSLVPWKAPCAVREEWI